MKVLFIILIFISTDISLGMGDRAPRSGANTGKNSPASWFSRRFESVSQSDLEAARNRYRAEACYRRDGLQVACGERSEWDNGDPTYNWDPYMNKIPRGTQVDVEVKCNPNTRKFYMNVKVNFRVCRRGTSGQIDQSTCRIQPKYFNNPYNARGGAFLQDAEPRWTTTPGLWPDTPTSLPINTRIRSDRAVVSGNGVSGGAPEMTEYHRSTQYAGAPMFHAVWIKNGIAVHGSDNNSGHAVSGGCLRLSQSNAMAFYRLARRVGTNNVYYNFGGYGPGNPPACATPSDLRAQVLAARESLSREKTNQYLQEMEAGLERQMAAEGRTRTPPGGNNTDPARSTQSIPSKQKKEK